MNVYLECYKNNKLLKRYGITQVNESGRGFLKRALKIDGFVTKEVESEIELETGTL